jgi:hypothetical protein
MCGSVMCATHMHTRPWATPPSPMLETRQASDSWTLQCVCKPFQKRGVHKDQAQWVLCMRHKAGGGVIVEGKRGAQGREGGGTGRWVSVA